MNPVDHFTQNDLQNKLKWLTFARLVFTTLLLGSTIILQLNESVSPLAKPLLALYGLIVSIFILSFFYALSLNRVNDLRLFAYAQIGLDTAIVSMIIFVTGGYASIFSFLYLVVIIYSSMLLYREGSMLTSTICSFQYALMCWLEFQEILKPVITENRMIVRSYDETQIIYKVLFTAAGCFAVAFLASLLSEQARSTKKELWAMEDQVRRVENMAAVGEMAAGLAHEIRNPLASLIGSIQILKGGIHLDPDYQRLMQIILREADRLNTLVNSFLLFAKPPTGKIESIELERAVADIVELFEKDQVGVGRITINKSFIPGLWVEMDPTHLHQVIWNLLINAAEAIEGAGQIDIRLTSGKHAQAIIEIADDGCGMTNETIQSIFDPFFTTKKNGTGLGLSIVHSILESYGCQLEVKSMIDAGTTFTLKLKCIHPPS